MSVTTSCIGPEFVYVYFELFEIAGRPKTSQRRSEFKALKSAQVESAQVWNFLVSQVRCIVNLSLAKLDSK